MGRTRGAKEKRSRIPRPVLRIETTSTATSTMTSSTALIKPGSVGLL